jgi:hypothetical protein
LGSSENRDRHDCNHASSTPPGPRPFSWGGASIPMVMTVRLGKRVIGFVRGKPSARRIDTFRNSTHRNGPMGSFGATDSREVAGLRDPFSRTCQWVRLGKRVIGFVRGKPSARRIDTFRNSTHRNGPMGSFGETDSREKSPVHATHSPEFANGFVSHGRIAGSNRYSLPLGSFVWENGC